MSRPAPGLRFVVGINLNDSAVARQFAALSAELSRRGHSVGVFTSSVTLRPSLDADGVDVQVWPSVRPTHWRDARLFARSIAARKPDCIVANFGAVNLMMVLGWLHGVPARVAWCHTMSSAISMQAGIGGPRAALQRVRKGVVYRAATHVVPVSRAAMDDARTTYCLPLQKCHVWPNCLQDPGPVDPSRLRPTNALVCSARLAPWKGQDVLIAALAMLRRSGAPPVVEFVGPGAAEVFRSLASRCGVSGLCRFTGLLPHGEALARMAAATLSVLPSRSDSCPFAAIESLAVGTPVVASAVGGIPEIVRDGVDGFLVPPDDPEALACRLRLLLDDPDLCARMGANARERFLDCFEQSRAVRAQADWLECIAEEAAARRGR